MATPNIQKTIRMPLDINRRLEEEARRTGQDQTKIILDALDKCLPKK